MDRCITVIEVPKIGGLVGISGNIRPIRVRARPEALRMTHFKLEGDTGETTLLGVCSNPGALSLRVCSINTIRWKIADLPWDKEQHC